MAPPHLRQETGFQGMVGIRLKQEVSVLTKKKKEENTIPQGCSPATVKLFNCCPPFCHRYAILIHGGKYFIKHLRARQLGSLRCPGLAAAQRCQGGGRGWARAFTEEALHKLTAPASASHLETIFSSGLSALIFHLFFFNQPPT